MKKILIRLFVVLGLCTYFWQGDKTLPTLSEISKEDLNSTFNPLLKPLLNLKGKLINEETPKLAISKSQSLYELEEEFKQLEIEDLKSLAQDDIFNQKLNQLVEKSNTGLLKPVETEELTFLIKKKAVLHKLILDHELELIASESL